MDKNRQNIAFAWLIFDPMSRFGITGWKEDQLFTIVLQPDFNSTSLIASEMR